MESPTFKNIEKLYFCFVNKFTVLFFPTYMRYHTMFVLLCLTYFTQYDTLYVAANGTVSFLLLAE